MQLNNLKISTRLTLAFAALMGGPLVFSAITGGTQS